MSQFKLIYMKTLILIIAIVLGLNTAINAQNTQSTLNNAKSFMTQGQDNLNKKEYTKARYFFKRAYDAFATQENFEQAVLCGQKVSHLYWREHMYKEAFELCRNMDALVWSGEQKLKKTFYDLRFTITDERLQIFTQLKNAAKAKEQLTKLEEIGNLAKNDSLNKVLTYTKANYYFVFGPADQGIAAYKTILNEYKQQKNWEKAANCYKEIIALAEKVNNAPLTRRMYEQYTAWTDSVKALTAADEISALKRKYDDNQQILQDKEDELSMKQYKIIALGTVTLILIAALAFLMAVLLRFMVTTKKQKKSIQIANEHNQLKSLFIRNISMQMEPTLNTLAASAHQLSTATAEAAQMQAQIKALKSFSDHIQELSTLENSLTEFYETNEFQIATFCEEIMDKIKVNVQAEVTTSVNAPKLQVKTNAEQLERILKHLLNNAAHYTGTGKISLEFKKRSAHTFQFIVTDTGTGIPVEQQETLFKPFTETRDLTQGDGLGLPICSLIATKMNGSLTLDTTYTKGSRFILELHS